MYCDWPQLGRCCFCMPLRKGVLTFGYIHILYSVFMIFMFSYDIEVGMSMEWFVFGRYMYLTEEICIAFFCFEIIFDGLLIYGAHKKAVAYLKAYFYYAMMTSVALLIMQIVEVAKMKLEHFPHAIDIGVFTFAGVCLQLYLVTMVWSLVKKMESLGSHVYDNQLHQIVNGELKAESNGVYNNTTTVSVDV